MNIETKRKTAVAVVGAALLLVACLVAIHFNRGGVGSVSAESLKDIGKCQRVDENTMVATVRYTGIVDHGSINVGATVRAVPEGKPEAELGASTERFVASGPFDKTLRISIDFDEDAAGDEDVQCYMSIARSGWHLPSH